jgi:TATA-box binding protein (TBP) (component of TFIID and TFIIIB)
MTTPPPPPTVPRLIVQNVVCDANLGAKFKLPDITEILQGRWDPDIFPAVVSIAKVYLSLSHTHSDFP